MIAPTSAVITSFVLFSATKVILAQASNPATQPLGRSTTVRHDGASNLYNRPDPFPYGNAPVRHDIRNPYFNEDNAYVTSTATPPQKSRVVKRIDESGCK